jgi:riboflavin transporter FmnP
MTSIYIKRRSVFLAGTALLGAVVVVLDVTFKTAGLKIPFPLLTFLRFDVLGIPVVLAYLLFGLLSGVISSGIALLSITLRSGDVFSGFMKFLAESATIVGVFIVLKTRKPISNRWKALAMIAGILVRVATMDIANVLLLPIFMGGFYNTCTAVLALIPLISVFNAIQGAVSIFGGFLLYEAVMRRLLSLKAA